MEYPRDVRNIINDYLCEPKQEIIKKLNKSLKQLETEFLKCTDSGFNFIYKCSACHNYEPNMYFIKNESVYHSTYFLFCEHCTIEEYHLQRKRFTFQSKPIILNSSIVPTISHMKIYKNPKKPYLFIRNGEYCHTRNKIKKKENKLYKTIKRYRTNKFFLNYFKYIYYNGIYE